MDRDKILAALLILAVAIAGGLQAAAVVPHVHGEDSDHSAAPACPVHQAQNHSIQADLTALVLPAPAEWTEAPPSFSSVFVFQTFPLQESLRAPPVSL